MKPDLNSLVVTVPEQSRSTLVSIAETKHLSPDRVAAIMIQFACRIMAEQSFRKGSDLATDLDLAKSSRMHANRRVEQLQGVTEKVILESQVILQSLRNVAPANKSTP